MFGLFGYLSGWMCFESRKVERNNVNDFLCHGFKFK